MFQQKIIEKIKKLDEEEKIDNYDFFDLMKKFIFESCTTLPDDEKAFYIYNDFFDWLDENKQKLNDFEIEVTKEFLNYFNNCFIAISNKWVIYDEIKYLCDYSDETFGESEINSIIKICDNKYSDIFDCIFNKLDAKFPIYNKKFIYIHKNLIDNLINEIECNFEKIIYNLIFRTDLMEIFLDDTREELEKNNNLNENEIFCNMILKEIEREQTILSEISTQLNLFKTIDELALLIL